MRRLLRMLAAVALVVRGRRRRRERAEAERREQLERREGLPEIVEREPTATPYAELLVLGALGVTTLAAIGFVVAYIVDPNTQLLGLTAGVAFAGLATACVVAARGIVPDERAESTYHEFGDEVAQEDVETIVESAADGVSRRGLLLGAAGAAGAAVAGAAIVPAASLGPRVRDRLNSSPWRRGLRLVREDGTPIRADEITAKGFVLAFPEGVDERHTFTSSVNVLRVALDQLELPPDRRAGAPEGIVAYSRICTHAGCAISMYRAPLFSDNDPGPALVCPCHYSTFDPRRGCAVEFGPAGRPLPQLPIGIGPGGDLEALGDFYDPPGPAWGRSRLGGPKA
jgi:ubiquinol-cytochrome c reductase iron-sulfur subunit